MKLPPFQRLVDEHWRDVGRLAHALAGPVDGDDVAQQAWAQALAAYPQLRSTHNLRGWLMTVTARCATDVHRARSRRAVPVADVVTVADGAPGIGPRTAPVRSDAYQSEAYLPGANLPDPDLWDAVRHLPQRQRLAVALRYVADLDHAEIAHQLGTTPAASRRLVSDALATLRATTDPARGGQR